MVPVSNLDQDTDCSVLLVFHILPTQISEQQLSYVTVSVFHIFSKSLFIFFQSFELRKSFVTPEAGLFVLCDQRPVV